MTKFSGENSGRADTEACRRCGKRKRADKLEPTAIGPCCRHCAAVIADVYGDTTP
jgi:hypothetical protein